MTQGIYDAADASFSKQDRAAHVLWVAIWTQAHRLIADESPSVLNKIEIVHEMTAPGHRQDPRRGAVALERYIAAHNSNAAYEKYLGPVVSALLKYANDCGAEAA